MFFSSSEHNQPDFFSYIGILLSVGLRAVLLIIDLSLVTHCIPQNLLDHLPDFRMKRDLNVRGESIISAPNQQSTESTLMLFTSSLREYM